MDTQVYILKYVYNISKNHFRNKIRTFVHAALI